jgi:hypothetical protein
MPLANMERMCPANELIQRLLRLSRRMIILADEGHAVANDDGCRLLFSILQDSAYKIHNEAEREREAHRAAGIWPEEKKIMRGSVNSDFGQF